MTVSMTSEAIVLAGACGVEEAEIVLAALLDHPTLPVDVAALSGAHLAVVQVLRAAARPLAGKPQHPLLQRLL